MDNKDLSRIILGAMGFAVLFSFLAEESLTVIASAVWMIASIWLSIRVLKNKK